MLRLVVHHDNTFKVAASGFEIRRGRDNTPNLVQIDTRKTQRKVSLSCTNKEKQQWSPIQKNNGVY